VTEVALVQSPIAEGLRLVAKAAVSASGLELDSINKGRIDHMTSIFHYNDVADMRAARPTRLDAILDQPIATIRISQQM